MTRRPALPQPFPHALWLLGLGAVAVVAAGILHVAGLTVVDRYQQLPLLSNLASGDLAHVWDRMGPEQTSGPGFGLFGVPLYGLLRPFLDSKRAYDLVSLSCLVPLAGSAVAASRATGVAARSPRELLNVAAVVLSMPVLACYAEAFHPADVLAVAATLGAFAAVASGRISWGFLLLGFAMATRHWALFALAVLAVLAPDRDRSRLVLGSCATAGVLILPFLIADPSQTIVVLVAKDVIRGNLTAAALLPLANEARFYFARYLPLLLVVAWCAWLHRRRVPFTPEITVAALAVALLLRPLVDPAGYVYYLAPGAAFAVLIAPRSLRWPVGGLVAGGAVWFRRSVRERFPAETYGDAGQVHLPGASMSVLTTLAIGLVTAAAVHRVVVLAAAAAAGEDGSGEGAAGGPGDTEAGDRVLG